MPTIPLYNLRNLEDSVPIQSFRFFSSSLTKEIDYYNYKNPRYFARMKKIYSNFSFILPLEPKQTTRELKKSMQSARPFSIQLLFILFLNC